MYLLYLDESGNENDPNDRYFVLAGLALFERSTYFLTKAIEQVQDKHFPNHQPIPFHASEIRSGRDLWRKVSPEKREEVIYDLCAAIAGVPAQNKVLFAAAVEKTKQFWGEAAVERATEQVCKRFDILLQRQYQEKGNPQRGLIIFSEGRFDARAIWVRGFHQKGTQWGAINNLADIPYFAPMRESRLLQAADIVAHATWLLFERRDARIMKVLLPFFDTQNGIVHGLVHVRDDLSGLCECPACFSRKNHGSVGPWIP
ncbi:MAG: DUF3800 domain-containing protein [Burkholderiales bacterium]